MKKVWIAILIATAISSTGCYGNRDLLDTNSTFNKAIIALSNRKSIEIFRRKCRYY